MVGKADLRSRLNVRRTVANLLAVTEAILEEAGVSNADLEASFLLEYLSGKKRSELLFAVEECLKQSVVDRLVHCVERRLGHEPLAYILGEWDFWSYSLAVSPAVLIPRKETEVLVEKVLERFDSSSQSNSSMDILDLGTGSGAIAIVLAGEFPHATIYAVDRSREALKIASENIQRYQLQERVLLIQSDWATGLAMQEKFDCIVSNPPYIKKDVLVEGEESVEGKLLQREVRCSEPMLALDGGSDGLGQIRRIIKSLPYLLKSGASYFMEIGSDQEDVVQSLFQNHGAFDSITVHKDYAGLPRVLQARKIPNY